jgi:CheY-like chemotaxis protein
MIRQNPWASKLLKQPVRRYDPYSHCAFRARLLEEKSTLRACLLAAVRSQSLYLSNPSSSSCASLALLLLNHVVWDLMGSDSIFAFIATYPPSNGLSWRRSGVGEFSRGHQRPTSRLCRSVTRVPLCREPTNRRESLWSILRRVAGTCDDWSFMSTANAESDSQPQEAPRILLLEDSPAEGELFCQALVYAWQRQEPKPAAARPTIELRHTAHDAIETLKSHIEFYPSSLPDLILLDFDLPAGNSLSFLRTLQQDIRLAKLPVIVMAWSDDESMVRSLRAFGVAGCVVKPLLFEDLIILVEDICRHVLLDTLHQEPSLSGRRQHA